MRLVVSGYYGFGNLGDEAILRALLGTTRELEGDAQMTVLSRDPAATSRLHDVGAVRRTDPLRVAAELRRADGLLSGGGGLLQDATSARPVLYYAGVMELARALRRPYAVVAQGIGPLRRGPNRRLAARALQGAAQVSLRDEESIALARALGVRRPITLAADPALLIAAPRRAPGSHVLVAVRGGGLGETLVRQLRSAVEALAAEHRVVALPMHDALDARASAGLVAGIRNAEEIGPDADLDAKLAAIAASSVVVGMRLHALVLAAAAGVPGVALPYDPKVAAFAQRAGMPIVPQTGAGPKPVLEAVAEASAQDRSAYLARVEVMRDEARAAVGDALAAIREAA